jgi:hypothetical protein
MNVCKPKPKLISKDVDVIFQFWNPKRKLTKFIWTMPQIKLSKNMFLRKKIKKQTKFVIYMNL